MAVGKSVVGKRLAQRLRRRFVDLDQAIENKEGMTVSEIFSRKGEKYFRAVEKQALSEILKKSGQVIATGGGAVLDGENLELLKQRTVLVCLTAASETLLQRSGSGKERPLLEGNNRREQIEELLSRREKSYAQAHFSIDTGDLSVDEVVERIVKEIGQLSALSKLAVSTKIKAES